MDSDNIFLWVNSSLYKNVYPPQDVLSTPYEILYRKFTDYLLTIFIKSFNHILCQIKYLIVDDRKHCRPMMAFY